MQNVLLLTRQIKMESHLRGRAQQPRSVLITPTHRVLAEEEDDPTVTVVGAEMPMTGNRKSDHIRLLELFVLIVAERTTLMPTVGSSIQNSIRMQQELKLQTWYELQMKTRITTDNGRRNSWHVNNVHNDTKKRER